MTRQEAVEILNNKGFTFCDSERCVIFYNDWDCEKCDEALTMAKKALQQEPKRGKWIDDDPHHHKYHRCSCCGTGEFNWESDNYCRNCGARMER